MLNITYNVDLRRQIEVHVMNVFVAANVPDGLGSPGALLKM
jgi:hypothetical protein